MAGSSARFSPKSGFQQNKLVGSGIMDWTATHTRIALERLATEILALFRSGGNVSKVCVFGSIASGSWDEWSDIDLAVGCGEPDSYGPFLAGLLGARFPILCHRPFSGQPAPSGRFWFRDQSPFHKLDVSFHTDRALESVISRLSTDSIPVLVHDANADTENNTCGPFRWTFSATQRLAANVLHRVSRCHRRSVRTGEAVEELGREMQALQGFMGSHTPASPQEEAYWELARRTAALVEGKTQPLRAG